jgi:hypothetical protein
MASIKPVSSKLTSDRTTRILAAWNCFGLLKYCIQSKRNSQIRLGVELRACL